MKTICVALSLATTAFALGDDFSERFETIKRELEARTKPASN